MERPMDTGDLVNDLKFKVATADDTMEILAGRAQLFFNKTSYAESAKNNKLISITVTSGALQMAISAFAISSIIA